MKKNKKKINSRYKAEHLEGFCNVETSIECSNCKKGDGFWGGDEFYASEEFFKKGWRATASSNVYCPTCAPKKLKP